MTRGLLIAPALAVLLACDVDVSDIPVEQRARDASATDSAVLGGPSRKTDRDAGNTEPTAAGAGGSATSSDSGSSAPPVDAEIAGGAPGAIGPNTPSGAGMSSDMDSGMDATTDKDAEGVAEVPPDTGNAPVDTRTDSPVDTDPVEDCDDDAGVCDDPCRNGTFTCVRVYLTVNADFGRKAVHPLLTVEAGDHTFVATGSADGIIDIQLPAYVRMHMYVTLPGYWRTDLLIAMLPGDTVEGFLTVFSDLGAAQYFGGVGQTVDPAKGIVLVTFVPPLDGAGAELNQPSSPAVVMDSNWHPLLRNTIRYTLTDKDIPNVSFANVEPGFFTPTMTGTATGGRCIPNPALDAVYEASPRTLTAVVVDCDPPTP